MKSGLFAQDHKVFGAVVQLGLGRQIVNLEVAGSNPVGPAIPHLPLDSVSISPVEL
jgi:hypothetical protein